MFYNFLIRCRAIIEGHSLWHLLQLSMLDMLLVLQVNLPAVERIHPQSNKFVTSVKIKATSSTKLNDSPQCSTYMYIKPLVIKRTCTLYIYMSHVFVTSCPVKLTTCNCSFCFHFLSAAWYFMWSSRWSASSVKRWQDEGKKWFWKRINTN